MINHEKQNDGHVIPEPTTIEQAEADGVATRIASGDTEGGSDQFASQQDESLSEEGDRTLRSGQEGAGQNNDQLPA